jgi:hypothetical protein
MTTRSVAKPIGWLVYPSGPLNSSFSVLPSDCPREQCPREGVSLETRNPDSNASRSPVVGRAVLTRTAMCPVLPSLVLTKVFVHLPGEFCLSTAARVNREWRVCAKLSVMQVHLKSLPGASLCSLQARQPHFGLHHEASVSQPVLCQASEYPNLVSLSFGRVRAGILLPTILAVSRLSAIVSLDFSCVSRTLHQSHRLAIDHGLFNGGIAPSVGRGFRRV